MLIEASIVGLVRTIVIIVLVVFLVKLIGQFLIARRRMDEERSHFKRKEQELREREDHLDKRGKISISQKKDDFQDDDFTDYEEIKE